MTVRNRENVDEREMNNELMKSGEGRRLQVTAVTLVLQFMLKQHFPKNLISNQ